MKLLRAEDGFSDENITIEQEIEDALWDFDPFQPPPPRIWVGDGISWIKRRQDNVDAKISRRRHERTGGGNSYKSRRRVLIEIRIDEGGMLCRRPTARGAESSRPASTCRRFSRAEYRRPRALAGLFDISCRIALSVWSNLISDKDINQKSSVAIFIGKPSPRPDRFLSTNRPIRPLSPPCRGIARKDRRCRGDRSQWSSDRRSEAAIRSAEQRAATS